MIRMFHGCDVPNCHLSQYFNNRYHMDSKTEGKKIIISWYPDEMNTYWGKQLTFIWMVCCGPPTNAGMHSKIKVGLRSCLIMSSVQESHFTEILYSSPINRSFTDYHVSKTELCLDTDIEGGQDYLDISVAGDSVNKDITVDP